ncbi:MAG: DUF6348 family protein [Pirellulales bacterium]
MIDDFYQAALAAVRHHLDEAGATYSLDDGEISLDGHRLGISIGFDEFVPQGNLVLAPLDVQIHLDGDSGDRFRVGTLGVGSDRAAAMQDAISEWHLLVVAPLLAALGAAIELRRSRGVPTSLAGWDLFPGRVGIRGPVPGALRAGSAFYQSLLSRLQQVVAGWDQPERFELRSIFVMATHSPTGCEVQAAIDGLVDAALVELLQGLPWPESAETYLYKQLFVLRAGRDE